MVTVGLCGFETGDALETEGITGTGSVQSSEVISGAYSFRANPTGSGTGSVMIGREDASSGAPSTTGFNVATAFARVYVRPITLPASGSEEILQIRDTADTLKATVRVTSTGTLQVFQNDGTTQVGSTSTSTLQIGKKTKLGFRCGTGTSALVSLTIDGSSENVGGTVGSSGLGTVNCGFLVCGKRTDRNGQSIDVIFDDIHVDDTAMPPSAKIVCLLPDADGTYSTWTQSGADTKPDHVNERPIDPIDYLISTTTTGDAQTLNLASAASAGITSDSIVRAAKLVWGGRRNGASNGAVRLRLRSNTTDSDTGADVATGNGILVRTRLYPTDPATGSAWAPSALDSVQVGSINRSANASRMNFAALMVDFQAPSEFSAGAGTSFLGAAALVGLGAIAATGRFGFSGGPDIHAHGAIAARGGIATAGGATAGGVGAMSARGTFSLAGGAALEDAGSPSTFDSGGGIGFGGGADLTGTGAASARGALSFLGGASATAPAAASAHGGVSFTGGADVDSIGDASAGGVFGLAGGAGATGTASAAAHGAISTRGGAALVAFGGMVADGAFLFRGGATVTGSPTSSASGGTHFSGGAALGGVGGMGARGEFGLAGGAQAGGVGERAAGGAFDTRGGASLAGIGAIEPSGEVLFSGGAAATGEQGGSSAGGGFIFSGFALAQGVGSMSAHGAFGFSGGAGEDDAELGFYERLGNAIRFRWKTFVEDVHSLPTQYDNFPFTPPNDGIWCRLTIQDGVSERADIFGDSNAVRWRTTGSVTAALYVPKEEGDQAMRAMADLIDAVFKFKHADGVSYRKPSVAYIGTRGKWSRFNVTCPFYADDVS